MIALAAALPQYSVGDDSLDSQSLPPNATAKAVAVAWHLFWRSKNRFTEIKVSKNKTHPSR
jgi:hypothetical protein